MSSARSRARSSTGSSDQVVLSPSLTSPETDALKHELVFVVSQVPVLFGTGVRYFGELIGGHVMLEDPLVVQGTRALHLRYPVRH